MSRHPAHQKAYTLIEVMMAATVLLVSFAGVIQAVTMGAGMIDTARKQQIAQQIIEGEIAHQRTLTWAGMSGQLGIVDMLNSPTFRIWVKADGTIGYDPVGSISVPAYFALTTDTALLAAAKGYSCRADSTNALRPWFKPPLITVTYTVTWTGLSGREHTRSDTVHFSQNGLHLSYQK